MTVRRIRRAALLAALLGFPLACKFEPRTPELKYSLNRPVIAKNADLADNPAAQAQLQGALEMMFGTPASPRILKLSDWDFDPNYWGEDLVMGDEGAKARLVESNRAAYRPQLEAIRAGDWAGVKQPRHADDLWRWWLDLRARLESEGPNAAGEEGTLRDDAVRLYENYYPTLANSATFYRNQCYHCHGSEGGGDGSTSAFLNPRPRDYRPGKFKFTALKGKARPRHEDLFRILSDGIYTTAMPSFRRFTDAQLHGLADYVRLLSMRGETEILLAEFYDPDEGLNFDNVKENFELVVGRWREAGAQLISYGSEVPAVTGERIEHGRTLFMTPGEKGGANCVSCHGTSGRGDGASAFEIDPVTKLQRRVKDDWGNEIMVRDLTRDVFRFGRRPIDLYRRIYAGINGTPMPEHFGMTITENGQQRTMNEDDIWDLVFFVRTLGAHAPQPAKPVEHGGEHK
jgi:mono/diheme cytochrome c family protein